MTALAAVAALAVTGFQARSRGDDLRDAQRHDAYVGCTLIVGILHTFQTPRGRANARAILAANPQLRDCRRYSLNP